METIRALGGSGQFWIIALHWGLLGFAGWAFVTWMPTFLREHYHLSQTEAGFTATAYMQVAAFLRSARRWRVGGSLEPHATSGPRVGADDRAHARRRRLSS